MLSVAGDVALPGIGNGAGTAYVCTTLATGVISTSTSACNPSSLRFKDNVADLSASRGLADVMKLRPVTFTYKPEMKITGNQVGFIAEEIVNIVPEAVGFDSAGLPYNVDYSKLTPVLAKAIQEIGNVISLKNAGTTTPSITVDTLGNVGIGTTTPDYKLQIAGDVAATSFVNVSTRDAKKDISYISDDSKRTILDKIKNIKVAEYRYNNEPDSNPLRMGLIAEEAPAEILSVTGKGVDVYKMSTFILAGVQEQQARLESMDARITKLESLIGSSTPITSDVSFSTILTSFENAGVKIENGITRIKNAIVDSLTVGSRENTAGITLYDTVTKEPYCLTIENGTPKSTSGACGSNPSSNNIATSTSQTGSSDLIPPVITITGANPAKITKGSVYVDLGATVDDNVNHNLGITATGDVNTSVVGTYPIVYSATDQAGNMSSTTRSVIVYDPNDIIVATSTPNEINSDLGTTTNNTTEGGVGN
jgi:hypothetical protein